MKPSRYLQVIWLIVTTLIVSDLIIFGLSTVARLPLQVEFMYGESIVLDLTRRVAHGDVLYPAPDHLPLAVTAYTPVYYLLSGSLQRLFGDSYVPGRIVSLVSALGTAALLAWSVRHVSGRWAGGLLAGGFFLTQNMTVLLWAPLHRVDLLALFLTLGGLALAAGGRPQLATLPLLLAVLTKQTYVVAPIAVCLALYPDIRAALRFAALYIGGLVIAIVIAQVMTGGWFLWHTVAANANPFDMDNLLAMLGAFLHFNGVPLLAASALFTLPSRPAERLWRFYFLGALLTLPAIGKIGASSNYWLEATAATAVLIGLLSDRLATRHYTTAVITESGLALLIAGSLLIPIPGYQAVTREALHVLPTGGPAAVRAQISLAQMLAAESGEILTDEPALAVGAGRPIAYEFVIFDLLVGQGRWDERPILEAVEAQRFSLVMLKIPIEASSEQAHWSPGLVSALTAAYSLVGHADGFWLYRPVSLGSAAQNNEADQRGSTDHTGR
jgi:hypothetical protein